MGELILLFFLILLLNIVDSIFILRYHQHLYGAVCWNRWKFAIRLVIVVLVATVVISAMPAMILWGMVLASSAWMGAYQGGKKNKVLFQVVLISLAVLSFILSFTLAIAFFKDEITIGIFTILASHVIFAVMAETTRHFNQSVLVDLPRKMWLVLLSIPAASLICVPAFSRMVALNGDNASGIGRTQVIILLPKGIRMDFCEAATLLGNLLDNVMDECLQLPKEKREAKIQISYTNHIMFIRISNPMAVAEKQLPLKSEKTDSELHGFGMKSVQQVVDQFNGTIKLIAQDYLFQISIVLYNV